VGVAGDVTGDGQTAVRAGYGTFYDRLRDGYSVLGGLNPPVLETLQTLNVPAEQLMSSALVTSTRVVTAFEKGTFHSPTIHNWSVGVQRQLPYALTLDVAYVGNIGRHDPTRFQLNAVPYGTQRTDLNPQNKDATNNGQPINIDYLRPYRTYQSIILEGTTGKSSYHSIQLSVQRRLRNGLALGFAYTGSVRKSYLGGQGNAGPILNTYLCPNFATTCSADENMAAINARDYNKQDSRPHLASINYNYSLPGLSRFMNDNGFAKAALDGWQVSGVTVITSGVYGTFGTSFTGAPFSDMTGGGIAAARVSLACDPNLPRSQRTFDRQFRTECLVAPGPSTTPGDIFYLGNAHGDDYLGLGYINHDLTLLKNFELGKSRRLQFRTEIYNVFNQTQYGTVNTSAQFDFATLTQTNASLGKVTAARPGSNRTIQLGLRFTF